MEQKCNGCLPLSNQMRIVKFLLSDLEVVMKHLLAVEQIRAGLTQITQVYLCGGDGKKNTE